MSRDARPHLRALTGLRFVAAFAVLLYHGLSISRQWPVRLQSFVEAGHLGVGLFFVLSGFILTYTYHDALITGRATWREFIRARFARIYPVYLLSLFVALPPLFWFFARKGGRPRTDWLASVVAQYTTLVQAWNPRAACALNCPAWSLSVEAFFYLAFLLALPVVARWGVRRLFTVAAAAWALSIIPPLLYMALRPDRVVTATPDTVTPWLIALKYNPLLRFPEFVMGMVAGRLFLLHAGRPRRWHGVMEMGALAAIVLAMTYSRVVPYPVLHNGLLAPAFAALVYALAWGAGPLSRALSGRVMVRLGAASFGLYMLHVPLAAYMGRALMALDVGPLAPGWNFLLFVGVGVAVSLLVFTFIEEPARRWLAPRRAASADAGSPTTSVPEPREGVSARPASSTG